MTIRLCRACEDFHDLDKPWPVNCYGHFQANPSGSSLQIIKDIEPYRAVAEDKRTGKVPVIRSRVEHREFLKANGYHERGNDPIRPKKPEYADVNPRELKQTIDRIIGRN